MREVGGGGEEGRWRERTHTVETVRKAREKRGGIEITGWVQSQQAEMAADVQQRSESEKSQRPEITRQSNKNVRHLGPPQLLSAALLVVPLKKAVFPPLRAGQHFSCE